VTAPQNNGQDAADPVQAAKRLAKEEATCSLGEAKSMED
jgi:hypothetical protein